MSRFDPKIVPRTEFDSTLGLYTVTYSDRFIYPPLPSEIAGVVNRDGYLATFYSGSFADPDRGIVGKLDVFREAMEKSVGELGRIKKYSFKLYIPTDVQQAGSIVAVREIPPQKIEGHWATEMEDEFLVHYLNSSFGVPKKR